MKILHLITTLGVGGAEKHLLWLGAGQRQRGHVVEVAYLKGQGELTGAFESGGMAVTKVPFERPQHLLSALRALRALLSERAPDVLHTHLLKADALGALAGRRAGVPVIVSSKHNDERALLRRSVGWIHGLLMRRVDRVIALSDHVAAFTARHGHVPRDRIDRIYYGIDAGLLVPRCSRAQMRAGLGLHENAPVIICVGRLAPQKDHPTLLAALTHLPPVTLLVVGGDPFGNGEQRLRELADELGLTPRVRFLGIRDDVPDLLGAADLFVLPSLWEGLGLVFLEAMAARLPIVASNVSAIPEVIDDGVSGWLVPPGDPVALASAVRTALEDPAARAARGLAGHMRLLERFALPRMIDETLAVYEDVRAQREQSEMRVVTAVCTGNLCRSPMAEALLAAHLRSLGVHDVRVQSSGTHARPGAPAMPEAVAALAALHLDLRGHRARRLGRDVVDESHLLLCATEAHRQAILSWWADVDGSKVRLFNEFLEDDEASVDVADPMGCDADVYDVAARVIDRAMEAWAHQLKRAKPGAITT